MSCPLTLKCRLGTFAGVLLVPETGSSVGSVMEASRLLTCRRVDNRACSSALLQGFMKSGTETTLKGHTKRVGCLTTHQHVLLSGASDGSVRCWQMNVHTQTFECSLVQHQREKLPWSLEWKHPCWNLTTKARTRSTRVFLEL